MLDTQQVTELSSNHKEILRLEPTALSRDLAVPTVIIYRIAEIHKRVTTGADTWHSSCDAT